MGQCVRGLITLFTLGLVASAHAQSTCDRNNLYTLDWNAQTQGYIGTGGTTYTVTNGVGTSKTVGLSFIDDITKITTVTTGLGSIQTPYVGVLNTGGLAASTEATLSVGTIFSAYQTNIDSTTNAVGIRFSFAAPVREVVFTVLDVDYTANQFRDWVKITGLAGATVVTPSISSPYGGRNNSTNPGQTAPSTTVIGPYTASTPNFGNTEVVGNSAASSETQDYGNLVVSFAQPVNSVTIRYANGPAAYIGGTPGQQAISIHDIKFCTMPDIALTKTVVPWSDPVNGTTNPKMIPGADVIYTLTVTNSGGSAVDLSTTVLSDPLPAGVTFYNGDIDDGGPLTTNYDFNAGTTGLTFGAANLTYSNSGGASYAYTPTAGYDVAVNALRFAPVGSMAANSSFTLKFRARIK